MPRGRPFVKGQKPPPGATRKGVPNRVTKTLREAIEASFEARGGSKYLEGLDDRDYVGLLGKLLPLQIEGGDPNRPVTMRWLGDDDAAPE